jgi:hypothetical protein
LYHTNAFNVKPKTWRNPTGMTEKTSERRDLSEAEHQRVTGMWVEAEAERPVCIDSQTGRVAS